MGRVGEGTRTWLVADYRLLLLLRGVRQLRPRRERRKARQHEVEPSSPFAGRRQPEEAAAQCGDCKRTTCHGCHYWYVFPRWPHGISVGRLGELHGLSLEIGYFGGHSTCSVRMQS